MKIFKIRMSVHVLIWNHRTGGTGFYKNLNKSWVYCTNTVCLIPQIIPTHTSTAWFPLLPLLSPHGPLQCALHTFPVIYTVLCYHIGIGLSSPISIKLRARACVCRPHITSVKLDTFNLADHYPHYHSNGHTPPAVPTVDTGQNSYLYPNLRPMLHMGKVSPEG